MSNMFISLYYYTYCYTIRLDIYYNCSYSSKKPPSFNSMVIVLIKKLVILTVLPFGSGMLGGIYTKLSGYNSDQFISRKISLIFKECGITYFIEFNVVLETTTQQQ